MVQVGECLPSKRENLSLVTSTAHTIHTHTHTHTKWWQILQKYIIDMYENSTMNPTKKLPKKEGREESVVKKE
jgi:hypothetical protein